MSKRIYFLGLALAAQTFCLAAGKNTVGVDGAKAVMQTDGVSIEWKKTQNGWELEKFSAADGKGGFEDFGKASGEYSLIFSKEQPKDNAESSTLPASFKQMGRRYKAATSAVRMNEAGEYEFFLPSAVRKDGEKLVFTKQTKLGKYTATWEPDKNFASDINITLSFEVGEEGYYSLPTPTAAFIEEKDMKWGIVPGWYQGPMLNDEFHLAYSYAQGLPRLPVICSESTISTMSSLMENSGGVTLAVTPAPGQDRNPYETNEETILKIWKVGLSHMNKHAQLSPTAYHPVIGQRGSKMKKGDKTEFKFTLSLAKKEWFEIYKHAIYDIYKLEKSLEFKDTQESLTQRVINMHKYLVQDETSKWRIEDYEGLKIGAQAYLGTVHGMDKEKKDAMKNSDIGAAWMLGAITSDPLLKQNRLPFMRNFKVAQQQKEPGFFQGAAKGQYYLSVKKIFTEEWASTFEPVGLTYYTLMDIGNILLFEPQDDELRGLLRLGADKLLEWQKEDGSWEVAYDKESQKPQYPDLKDYRPTFYGMVIAYRILKDEKYLEAAKKGADWFVKEAVEKASFLGVCGDVHFVNDFATGQSAQALLDLYEFAPEKKYLDAAVKTARMYTTSVYTHPIPTAEKKKMKSQANGQMKEVYDWQISQVGLSFEHGGCMGSAFFRGPILLLSHGAMFVKFYEITGDKLFLDMARAGALGRDAFVNEENHVASYYWINFDNGPGRFPHHAWWQVGWIFDYLVAEAEMRSAGKIKFPRGFITPKVGPQRSLGFASGTVDGVEARLVLKDGLVNLDNPNVNYITAISEDASTLFVVLMNDQTKGNTFNFRLNPAKIEWKGVEGKPAVITQKFKMKPFGIEILKFTKK